MKGSRLYIDANWRKLRFSVRGMLTLIARSFQSLVNIFNGVQVAESTGGFN